MMNLFTWKRTGVPASRRAGRAGFPTLGKTGLKSSNAWKKGVGGGESGAALIVALWVLIILSLLIGGFAFEMHIEAGITSYQRKKLQAQYLARGGVEYARMLLIRSADASEDDEATSEENEALVDNALRLSRGVTVSGMSVNLGRGRIILDIAPEEGRRNVNMLTDEEWEELLDQANVPEDDWPDLIDCFKDWIDEGDEHQLNGAESDDAFYENAGYKCKNAKLDTVDELLLIKGFTPAVVYGEKATEDNPEPMTGIARHLTTWGDGRINVNTATREVLMTLPGIDEWVVDAIIEGRVGEDGEAGTRDDGWDSVDDVLAEAGLSADLKDKITVKDKQYVRVISQGEVGVVRAGIWCVMEISEGKPKPVFWREEIMD